MYSRSCTFNARGFRTGWRSSVHKSGAGDEGARAVHLNPPSFFFQVAKSVPLLASAPRFFHRTVHCNCQISYDATLEEGFQSPFAHQKGSETILVQRYSAVSAIESYGAPHLPKFVRGNALSLPAPITGCCLWGGRESRVHAAPAQALLVGARRAAVKRARVPLARGAAVPATW